MKAYKPKITNSSLSIRYALMSLSLTAVGYSVITDHLSEKISYDRMSALIMVYNIIAVGLMGILSLFADRVKNKHTGVRLSALLTVLGYFLPTDFGITAKVILLALGSAVFHAFAVSSILSRSGGRSRDIGLFLGGEALGIAICQYGGFAGHFLAPFLMICAIPDDHYPSEEAETEEAPAQHRSFLPFIIIPLMICAYAVLSLEFSFFEFKWDVGFKTHFQLLAAIGLGCAVGGFAGDLIGRVMTVSISSCAGTLLICFCSDNKTLSLLGLAVFSCALAPIITETARFFPRHRAFAFSLLSAGAYLGQSALFLYGFKRVAMLFVCAGVIAVTVAADAYFSQIKLEAKVNDALADCEGEEENENEAV